MPTIESFRKASPSRQLAALAGGIAVIALLLALFYYIFLRSDYGPLFGDLSVADAARIAEELDAAGIAYRIEADGTRIDVSQADMDQARLAVMRADIPIESTVGFELFNESNLGLTEFTQKINYQRALQGELARTIMALEMVEAARVHISMAEPTIFRGDRTPPTASVTLLARPGRALPPSTVEGIQRLVAASVPELGVENVVILDQNGRVVSGTIVSPAMASPRMRERNAIESYYQARIEQSLQAYRRDGEFEVAVSTLGDDSLDSGDASAGFPVDGLRDFGLAVTVATELAHDPADAAAIRLRVQEVIGTSPNAADTIAVTVPQTASAPRQPASGTSASSPPQPIEPAAVPDSAIGWVLLAGLAGALAWLLLRIRRRGMSTGERQAMISRFNELLEGGTPDAR